MADTRTLSKRGSFHALVLVGSLWGFSEVVLGAGLRSVAPDLRAGGLVAVGMLLMGALFGATRKTILVVPAALIAASCRQLAVPLLQASLLCKANASIAVLLQGTMAAGFIAAAEPRASGRPVLRGVAAGIAALAAAGAFWGVGMHVAPCAYLLSFNRPDGLAAFLFREGIVWAALSSIAFPIGSVCGARLRQTAVQALPAPRLYYASSALVSIVAWVAAGLVTAAGY